VLLLSLWILPALTVFLIARSRMLLYTAPLLAPMSILFARAWCRTPAGGWPKLARTKLPLVLWAVVLVVALHVLRSFKDGPELHLIVDRIEADAGGEKALILNGTGRPHGTLTFFAKHFAVVRDVSERPLTYDKITHSPALPRKPGDVGWTKAYVLLRKDAAVKFLASGAPARKVFDGKRFSVFRLPGRI
jgi:hypothetical protein